MPPPPLARLPGVAASVDDDNDGAIRIGAVSGGIARGRCSLDDPQREENAVVRGWKEAVNIAVVAVRLVSKTRSRHHDKRKTRTTESSPFRR